MLRKIPIYLRRIHNLFITNKISLQLKALSNGNNFTVITVLHNNNVLTWDYKNNIYNQNKIYCYFCNPMSVHHYYVKL